MLFFNSLKQRGTYGGHTADIQPRRSRQQTDGPMDRWTDRPRGDGSRRRPQGMRLGRLSAIINLASRPLLSLNINIDIYR